MSWFEDYFGFKESASYSEIQAEFSLDDRLYLHCSKSRFPKQYVGEFTTPSLTELKQIRDTTADSDNDAKEEEQQVKPQPKKVIPPTQKGTKNKQGDYIVTKI